jgi:hypothetical protein
MRAARNQLEKLACGLVCFHLSRRLDAPSFAQQSTRSELLEQTRSQLYVEWLLQYAYMSNIPRRASDAQEYLTRHAQDLDEVRSLWTAIVRRREALSVCCAPQYLMSRYCWPMLSSVSRTAISFSLTSNSLCSFKTCRNFFLLRRNLQTSKNLIARETRWHTWRRQRLIVKVSLSIPIPPYDSDPHNPKINSRS